MRGIRIQFSDSRSASTRSARRSRRIRMATSGEAATDWRGQQVGLVAAARACCLRVLRDLRVETLRLPPQVLTAAVAATLFLRGNRRALRHLDTLDGACRGARDV